MLLSGVPYARTLIQTHVSADDISTFGISGIIRPNLSPIVGSSCYIEPYDEISHKCTDYPQTKHDTHLSSFKYSDSTTINLITNYFSYEYAYIHSANILSGTENDYHNTDTAHRCIG